MIALIQTHRIIQKRLFSAQVSDLFVDLGKFELHVVGGNDDQVIHGRGRLSHVENLVSPPLYCHCLALHAYQQDPSTRRMLALWVLYGTQYTCRAANRASLWGSKHDTGM